MDQPRTVVAQQTFVEIYAGTCQHSELGLELGLRMLGALENDEETVHEVKKAWTHCALPAFLLHQMDATNLSWTVCFEPPRWIFGGFPCQPFSLASGLAAGWPDLRACKSWTAGVAAATAGATAGTAGAATTTSAGVITKATYNLLNNVLTIMTLS